MIRMIAAYSAILLCLTDVGLSLATVVPLEKSTKDGGHASSPSSLKILDCSNATPLQLGSSIQGSTVGLASSVDSYGCSEWTETGGDIVYALSIASPTSFEIRLTADCDLDVALLNTCDPDLGCLLVADTGMRTTTPVMGDFFIVVDGYNGSECDFTLEIVETGPSSIDPEACQSAAPLVCETTSLLSGDTCLDEDHIRAIGCETYPSAGSDVWYQLTVESGGSFQVDLAMPEADAVLWVLGGCGEAAECLDFSDVGTSGEQESVAYSNEGLENRTVFLVIDSYGPATCGTYEGNVSCSGVIVSAHDASWSALKAQFHSEEK